MSQTRDSWQSHKQKYINEIILFQDQYQFCYRAALEYLSSFDHYTDSWQSSALELGVWANYVILRLFGEFLDSYWVKH